MGKAKTLPDYPRGLTFEDVWAALMETRERQERDAREWREAARKWEERQEKDARKWEEEREEMNRVANETNKQLGNLGNRFGEVVEYMVKPCMVEKFRELGFVFNRAWREDTIRDDKNNILTEVDITLENGDKVMIVEVKSKPSTYDITDHIKRMEIVRTRANLRNDNRIYLGAIAGAVMNDDVKTFALKNGFYVIEPSGKSFAITVPEGIYSPRTW